MSLRIQRLPVTACLLFLSWVLASLANAQSTEAIAFFQSQPATRFDLFLTSAQQNIAVKTNWWLAHTMTAGECLKITDYTTHKIPEPILQDWTSLSHLSFSHYRYSPRTKEFTASFDLLAPSHHPVYTHALDHKGEKAREALLLSAHSMASTFVRSGITDASLLGRWDPDPSDEMMQSHALMQEARSRTRVILTWHFQSTAAAATSDTPTFRELREEGVTVRHYKAVGALSDQERNPEEAVAISHKDFATNQDFFRWITEPDVRLPPPENKAR